MAEKKYLEKSRVLEILHDIGGCGAKPDTWKAGFDDAINAAYDKIANEPTITIRHGEWNDFLKCSECGQMAPYLLFGLKYCPNCGAIMDGKDGDR